MDAVYLDNNATTRVAPAVVDAMLPFFGDQFGNPSSRHAFGSGVSGALKTARRQVQALLGAAHDHEVTFTSGGTESNSTAILSALETMPGRNEIVTSAVEHPAILSLCAHLERQRGIRVHRIPVDRQGRLDIAAYRAALSDKVAVASIMWANNETGTLFPVAELAELARQAGALFHTDAVQAAGKLPIDLKEAGIDMLSLSGHKLHGPKGIGVLYVRRGTPFCPLLRGGQQERGRRAGTENTPAIVGLGKAAELALAHMDEMTSRVRPLRDRLEDGLLQRIPDASVTGDRQQRLPNTAHIAFADVDAEGIVALLDRQGIACSTGSACASGSMEPSHVLRAMGFAAGAAHGALRFSLSRDSTEREIDRVIATLPGIVETLRTRSVSPAGTGRSLAIPMSALA
ncbi:cysteine desulfurase NifS [Agrobacterium sp. a22-2]|uniref:cysteine desulfurase NifS n=1 Tax=Agrobacterium sp. a22-2 TaxID=2283840 RepID=UPI0014464835|nr:cysteine desulfurase NifS [Agrobacterium sp. a22-2]NKN34786.1 cysteine desulfurase NifS [Agrobacterium sp. a22-2]